MEATEGTYVTYPFGDLLRLVALESSRQQCAVVGEDLGTVPAGFRETMRSANLLSCRVLWFERRPGGGFVSPAEYPALAAAAAATHDLPTLRGFWLGTDIAWRRRLGLYPDAGAAEADAEARRHDRGLLLQSLVEEALLAPERLGEFLSDNGTPTYAPELGDAISSVKPSRQIFPARSTNTRIGAVGWLSIWTRSSTAPTCRELPHWQPRGACGQRADEPTK